MKKLSIYKYAEMHQHENSHVGVISRMIVEYKKQFPTRPGQFVFKQFQEAILVDRSIFFLLRESWKEFENHFSKQSLSTK